MPKASQEQRVEELSKKVGGRFKLTALIQRRWLELMRGARPLVDPTGKTPMEIVIDEILQDKLSLGLAAPNASKSDEHKR
jgi:DNA-directed RNA polymerase subunit omega